MGNARLFKKWWWFAIPIAFFLTWYTGHLLDRLVEQRLEELGARIAGEGYSFTIEKAEPSFFRGSIEVHGIALTHQPYLLQHLDSGLVDEVLELSADRLILREVSYWDLLTDGDVSFTAVEVLGPWIHYSFRPADDTADGPADDVVEEEELTTLPAMITVDTLLIRSAIGSTTDITGERPSFQIGDADIKAYDIELITHDRGRMTYTIGGADISATGLAAELPPLYDLTINSLQVHHPKGSAVLQALALVPRAGPDEYQKVLEHENDHFDIRADSIVFERIDAARFIADQVLHMGSMWIHSPVAIIHRDKTMSDGPFNYRHLPVGGLKDLGISIRIDSAFVHEGRVEYHEKDKPEADYGVVSFDRIEGLMTGLNNAPRDTTDEQELTVNATARVYESTPVRVHYRAPLASTHDAFHIQAELGPLPFKMFNRMTDDLLNVQATAGDVRSLRLHMQGNEWQASGTLDLAYDELHIDIMPQTGADQGRLKNLLANALVRRRNLPERKNYRQGVFKVDRRKDRAIFNFIWQGIKAGSVDTMAPGLFRKQMRKAAAQRNN